MWLQKQSLPSRSTQRKTECVAEARAPCFPSLMCGRYTLKHLERFPDIPGWTPDKLEWEWKELLEAERQLMERSYNIPPSVMLPVMAPKEDGNLAGRAMRWGFVSAWEGEKPKLSPPNARSEEVFNKGMFKRSVQKRRCIVPADGFFEWKKLPDSLKQPYHIQLRGGRPFWFAGIYEDATEIRPATFALLTTRPNAVMEPIHDRMPVILNEDSLKTWSTPGGLSEEALAAICGPYAAEAMEAWPVSSIVNSVKNNVPECVERRDGIITLEPMPRAGKKKPVVDDGQGDLFA
jgi:putative SOS response-associated peptidase YedK